MAYQSIPSEESRLRQEKVENKDDCTFHHYDHDEQDGPDVPATIYTSAMLCTLGFSGDEFWTLGGLMIV